MTTSHRVTFRVGRSRAGIPAVIGSDGVCDVFATEAEAQDEADRLNRLWSRLSSRVRLSPMRDFSSSAHIGRACVREVRA